MTARVLVIDDKPASIELLEEKLVSEYYDVLIANGGTEGLEKADNEQPDIIILNASMQDIDGFETIKQLKLNHDMLHVPVIMLSESTDKKDCAKGLELGADDFIITPFDDTEFFARIRSLVRIKSMVEELRLRNLTEIQLGLVNQEVEESSFDINTGKILLIDDDKERSEKLLSQIDRPDNVVQLLNELDQETITDVVTDTVIKGEFDLLLISSKLEVFDGLRLCSQLLNHKETKEVPIITLLREDQQALKIKSLDMGVHDYLMEPIDEEEMTARINIQIREKRYLDALRYSDQTSMSVAVIDGLTHLYNRHYFNVHYGNMVKRAQEQSKSLAVLMIDIDFFKQINDTYGHQAGDAILKQVASRILDCVRTTDLLARYGGEEFVIVMHDTPKDLAQEIAERIRTSVSWLPFEIIYEGQEKDINLTFSVGISMLQANENEKNLLSRSDMALYEAKESGRDRVVIAGNELPPGHDNNDTNE